MNFQMFYKEIEDQNTITNIDTKIQYSLFMYSIVKKNYISEYKPS
jgi:hypothetical protein